MFQQLSKASTYCSSGEISKMFDALNRALKFQTLDTNKSTRVAILEVYFEAKEYDKITDNSEE